MWHWIERSKRWKAIIFITTRKMMTLNYMWWRITYTYTYHCAHFTKGMQTNLVWHFESPPYSLPCFSLPLSYISWPSLSHILLSPLHLSLYLWIILAMIPLSTWLVSSHLSIFAWSTEWLTFLVYPSYIPAFRNFFTHVSLI